MNAESLILEMDRISDPIRAKNSERFFKTGKGEYGEGDKFIGITMPQLRKICQKYRSLSLSESSKLLSSPIHEHRMSAVVIMSDIFKSSNPDKQSAIYNLYLESVKTNKINNWDLIDVSAPHVVGEYIFINKTPEVIIELAKSKLLWEKRTAVLATSPFLKNGISIYTIKVSEILLKDEHDLIQKAVGWFLREMGKRVSEELLLDFLDKHAHEMPRTMLRYSLEKLNPILRQKYMSAKRS